MSSASESEPCLQLQDLTSGGHENRSLRGASSFPGNFCMQYAAYTQRSHTQRNNPYMIPDFRPRDSQSLAGLGHTDQAVRPAADGEGVLGQQWVTAPARQCVLLSVETTYINKPAQMTQHSHPIPVKLCNNFPSWGTDFSALGATAPAAKADIIAGCVTQCNDDRCVVRARSTNISDLSMEMEQQQHDMGHYFLSVPNNLPGLSP